MLTTEFLTAGQAIFTVELPESFRQEMQAKGKEAPRPWYTYQIERIEATEKYPTEKYFVSLLVGSDNTSDYAYMGMLNPNTGAVALTKGSAKWGFTEEQFRVRLIRRVLAAAWEGRELPEGWKLHHEMKCGRCGRSLTEPTSIERGIGPECWRKMHATDAA